MSKVASYLLLSTFYLALPNLLLPSPVFATNQVSLGLHVGSINAADNSNAEKIARIIKDMGVKSTRLIFQYPSTAEVTAHAIKQLNNYGIDAMVTILPHSTDYSDPSTSYSNYPDGSTAFEELCGSVGWRWMYKYSTINQELYRARIESLINTINQAGGRVSAFEIGNEIDWACFNGDIPVIKTNSSTNPYDLSQTNYLSDTVIGYAETLKTSYESIKELHPGASVLTFGAANTYLYDSTKPHIHYPNFLLWLTNINGVNYLTKYSDATAMHFYPQFTSVDEILNSIGPAFTNVTSYQNRFWITEFGFSQGLPQYSDPSTVEQLRLSSYHNFIHALNTLNQVIVERAYLYSFEQSPWTIMNPDSTPLLSAQIFNEYNPPQPTPTLDIPDLPAQAGDLNGDGKVDIFDYQKLISNFGNPYTIFDYQKIISNFGK